MPRKPNLDTKQTVAERNRRWRENNADRTSQVTVFIPKTAHEVWKKAGQKSGLFMPGLMMAVLDFLAETDGEQLLEIATRNGQEHGLRVSYVDPETDKVTKVSTGSYRISPRR